MSNMATETITQSQAPASSNSLDKQRGRLKTKRDEIDLGGVTLGPLP